MARRRSPGEHSIYYNTTHGYYEGVISLGFDDDGKRVRVTVTAKTKAACGDKLKDKLKEIEAGVRTSDTYTLGLCCHDWLESLPIDTDGTGDGYDPQTIRNWTGVLQKWIDPTIGKKLLRDVDVDTLDRFLARVAPELSQRSLALVKSILRRSVRRAQARNLIGRNVVDLVDLPKAGKPGRPSRAMDQDAVNAVLRAITEPQAVFVRVVTISDRVRSAATHAARPDDVVACGMKPRPGNTVAEVDQEVCTITCGSCRYQLRLDSPGAGDLRFMALFTVAVMLGLRPGELRALRWDHVDFDRSVLHVWKSSRLGGDTKTPQSKRSPRMPLKLAQALKAHREIQDAERDAAGALWADTGLVFTNEWGQAYSKDSLGRIFARLTEKAGVGHWHPHEGRHTFVSILDHSGVDTRKIADLVGHKNDNVTRTVYRHLLTPDEVGGAEVMDDIF